MRKAHANSGKPVAVRVLDSLGRRIARHLEKSVRGCELCTPSDPAALRRSCPLSDSTEGHTA
jgi:hypothetical protein